MKRRAAAMCGALLIAAVCLTSCHDKDISGQGFRFPLAAEPRQLDPQVSADAASVTVVASLFEGLARLDENGEAIPAAATWTVSDDGMTYTFELRDSLWSDGTKVTAQDFVYGMQRAVQPSTGSGLYRELYDIQNAQAISEGTMDVSELGVRAVSDTTLTVTLTEPNDTFPAKTATTPYMPCKQSFFESTVGRYGLEKKYVLTNGPFLLKSWKHGQSLLLNKNDGYHDAASILPAAVRYVITAIDDPVASLKAGSVDAAPIPSAQLSEARREGLTLVQQQDTVQFLWFNNKVAPLSNASVRRALRGGIEWDTLYGQLDHQIAAPASGFAAPDASLPGGGYYRSDTNVLTPPSMQREALALLQQGLQEAGASALPQLTLLCADDDYSQNLARYIVQSWQKNLSVYFVIEAVSASQLSARVQVGNYQLALYECVAPGPAVLDALSCFMTNATGNYARFSDSGYDVLCQNAVLGNTDRAQLEQLEQTLWDACPSVPVSFVSTFVGIPAGDSGIVVRSFGGGAFGAPYDFRHAGKVPE